MEKIKVIAVVGATASGKTGLGAFLASKLNGEVVSADSMQVYEGMDIATAKPEEEEMLGVPHHLIGHVPLAQRYSVAEFVKEANACIDSILARGRLPVIVGGTGLYIDSLLEGVEFFEQPDNTSVRDGLRRRLELEGARALLDELYAVDPEAASQLHENNTGRIIRALEVYALTGETITDMRERSRLCGSRFAPLYISIEFSDRQRLYERINERTELMLKKGLLQEAQTYLSLPEGATARQAIGYKELRPYFDGECTLAEAAESLKRETRRYAKRQLTWFKRNGRRFVVSPDTDKDFALTALNKAREFLAQNE